MKTKSIGMLGELAVSKQLISQGYEVFSEVGDDSRVDLIVHKDGRLARVQIKTVMNSSIGTVPIARFKTTNHQKIFYTAIDIDVATTYVLDRDVILYAHIDELGMGTSRGITVRFDPPKNRQKYNRADDYRSFERVFMRGRGAGAPQGLISLD